MNTLFIARKGESMEISKVFPIHVNQLADETVEFVNEKLAVFMFNDRLKNKFDVSANITRINDYEVESRVKITPVGNE